MSFQATLTIEGKSFNVLQCKHSLSQKYERGKPTSGVRGGAIQVIIDGTDDDLLGSWATSPTLKKDGEITFDRVDQKSSLQKLEFQEAYATVYLEFLASDTIDSEGVHNAIIESIQLDMVSTTDPDNVRAIDSTKTLVKFTERTGVSNCILLRISAAKIKLDGIEHQNT
ncbi:type VI secretion system tube protein TssD [Spirosoma foliorum]|uniref:Phage tail protein n=1 Tax=Spirosoma foliorum TaxID=2710596 RepID=A0A7G5H053_9BACT|nr:type VI secretion system tube protein TssD [Spirosoma foliorum]QMW04495.1 hypothetical protein H3H32_06010 [Spirosoma foliorum]